MVGVPVVGIGNVRPANIAPTGVESENRLNGQLADFVAIRFAGERPLLISQDTQENFRPAFIQIQKSRASLPLSVAQRFIRCRWQSHPGAVSHGSLALGYELMIHQEQVTDTRYSIRTTRVDNR